MESSRVVGGSIQVNVETFIEVLKAKKKGIIATAKMGLLKKYYAYQICYDGFVFYLRVDNPIEIPQDFDVVVAEKIFTPLTMVR